MRVLVTGSNGYIGAILLPMLVSRGHDAVGMDINLFLGNRFGSDRIDANPQVQDIRDITEQELEGFDAILHLAGLSNDPLGSYRPEATDEINHKAAVRIARMAKRVGVSRFVFASSCSNYGASGRDFLDEDSEFRPVTPYGRSKADAERSLRALADTTFSPTYLRAATAFGVSPLLRFDLVVNNLTAWACATGRIRLKSDGSAWRPVVHVADIALAYIAAIEAPREAIHNQAFNVGTTAENFRVRELAEIVRDVVPHCELEFADGAKSDDRCYRVDCNRIARVLPGFKPQWTARRGVEELYLAFRRAGLTSEDIEGSRFNRLPQLQQLVSDGRVSEDIRWISATDRLVQEL